MTRRVPGSAHQGLARVFAWGLTFLCWPADLARAGQEQQNSDTDVRVEGTRHYSFAAEVELTHLLAAASDAIATPLEYDPELFTGVVRMDPSASLTAEQVWDQVNRELRVRGYTSVQPPDSTSLRVVPMDQALGLARLEDADLEETWAGFVRVLVPLEHRSTAQVAGPLRLLSSKPHGSVEEAQESGALLLSDFRAHMSQSLRALRLLDAADSEPLVVEISLEHAGPASLSGLVDRLVQSRKAVTGSDLKGRLLPLAETGSVLLVAPETEIDWWRSAVARFDRPEPVVTIHYTPRRFGLEETAQLVEEVIRRPGPGGPWHSVLDHLTGSLILSTTPSRHEAVNDLLNRLESTEYGARHPMRSYPIQHRRVSEVLDLLQGLLDAGVLERSLAADDRPMTPTEAIAAIEGPTGPIDRDDLSVVGSGPDGSSSELTLAADEGTNRILAFGEARLLDQLGLLIEVLDERHAQVVIEAMVVTLNENQSRQVGVELQRIGAEGSTQVFLSSLFGLGGPDPALGTIPPPGGAGFGGVVLDPGEFSAVVRALETVSQGRSLTAPKVLVANNEEATLDSTVQTPYSSTNASNTVATTSFGGTFDAGTTITVKPQVAQADQVLLDYSISLSTFVGTSADPNLPPPRQQNRLQAVATVPDGHTVVVGGLEIESQSDGESRVPLLGSIPWLGSLFKDRSVSSDKSRFFVFMRCTVLRSRSFEDLRYVSQPVMAAAGIEDGWPVLEPRVMR